jgi:hypothetical protein
MRQGSESDVAADERVAESRDSGGRAPDGEQDKHSTTGTTRNENYVGRVSGDESGFEGESGAEARSASGEGAQSGSTAANRSAQGGR